MPTDLGTALYGYTYARNQGSDVIIPDGSLDNSTDPVIPDPAEPIIPVTNDENPVVKELEANNVVYDIFGKGVINQHTLNGLKFWTGTKAEYNSIEHNSDTVYNITDEGTTDYSANIDLSNLSTTGQDLFDAKSNTSLSNLTSTGKNIGTWSSNVTNCITEIPQDIKLELNNGTLTLKSGSKLYVPNGFESDGTTPKFDVVTIASDIIRTGGYGSTSLFVLLQPNNVISIIPISYGESGPTSTSTGQYRLWYDTANNVIKYSDNSGSTWTSGYSFPLSIVSTDASSITSLDQVFNGFGYIGSTVFALPGLKGLATNGRNSDGSLKNNKITLSNVKTNTFSSSINGNIACWINPNDPNVGCQKTTLLSYNEEENILMSSNVKFSGFVFSTLYVTSGSIKEQTRKTTFHALDYNDKTLISSWGMPSRKYVDLTLGVGGTEYPAPANGYFTLFCVSNNTTGWYGFNAPHTCIRKSPTSNYECTFFVPVKKGDVCSIQYGGLTLSFPQTYHYFSFVYAEGEV